MLSTINGKTDLYPILGDPVEQVRAPESFNLIFATLGINAVMVPVQVPAELVQDFIRAAFSTGNIKGLLLTIPHKSLVMDMLDECSALARLAGAVNAIRCEAGGRLVGDLFDGEGLVQSLNDFGIPYTGKRVLMLGAGGGAAAIAASLVSEASKVSTGSAAKVALYDLTPNKAETLAQRLATNTSARVVAVDSPDPSGFDVVINATPLGLHASDPMPCDVSRMAPRAALVDILMKNQPSPVVRAACERGLGAQPGVEMLIQQCSLYLDFFGLHDAARTVEQDLTFLRRQLYPQSLQQEIPLR